MPISITVAATAAIPLLLLVVFRFFPILSVSEIEELAEEHGTQEVGA